MKEGMSHYFERKESRFYFYSMISISFLMHTGIVILLLFKTSHARNPNIYMATVAPVRLVSTAAVSPPAASVKPAPPQTSPPPKIEKQTPPVDDKGPPVWSKQIKTKKKKKPPRDTKKPSSSDKDKNVSMKPFGANVGVGQTLGGILAGSEEFKFNWYVDMVIYRIQKNWAPPFEVGKIGKTLKTVVLFEIFSDGSLGQVLIEDPSGSKLLDEAAITSIRASFPVVPLPRYFPDNVLRLHFYISHTF